MFTIEVDAEDANNDVDPTYDGLITLSLGNNPGGRRCRARLR